MPYLTLRALNHQVQVWEELGGPFEWLVQCRLCRQSTPGCCLHLQDLTTSTKKAVMLYAAMATFTLQSIDANKVQGHRQHATYKKDCNTRAPALTGLAQMTLADDIHICFNHHAKAQASRDIFVKGAACTTKLDGIKKRAADFKL